MKVALFVILLILVDCSSCNNDENIYDNNGAVISRPYVWKTSITDDDKTTGGAIAIQLVYKEQNVVVSARKNGHRSLLSLNTATGNVNWQWDDLLSLITDPGVKDYIYIEGNTSYLKENLLFFTYSTSSYCIDLSTGQTYWKYKIRRSRPSINSGLNDSYFSTGSNYDIEEDAKIYTGNILSPVEEQLLLTPDYTSVAKAVLAGRMMDISSINKDGIDYLIFAIENPTREFTPAGWGLTELNLYNLTEKKYVYKKVAINPIKDTRAAGDITYQAPNLYFQSSKYILSYNAMTGVENWRTYLGSAPLLSNMLLAENKLFSACEDDNYLFCLDATTGSILWKIHNTGTCSPISYLNGVLYFLGGGDGLLHAVEAATGKVLWKIKSLDVNTNSAAYFYGSVNAMPGKNGGRGVVVATSGLNAYAYEAAR